MNSPFRHLLLALGTLLISATAAQAQLQLSAPAYFNHLKLPGSTALGSVNPVPASQFSSLGVSSGSAGPRNQAVPTAEPRFAEGTTNGSTSIKLTSARVGNAFATGVPRYYLGDFITPPLVQADKVTPAPAGYWRAKPVRDNETFSGVLRNVPTDTTLTNPVWTQTPAQEAFYYSPHADAVFASQPGAVEIVWVTTAPQGGEWKFWKETFNVSSATQRAIRTIYWTEKSFNGPRVNIPGGRIERVNPVFSTAFPPTVVDEYVPVGEVINPDPNGQPAEEKRTLWFDQIGGSAQIAAYNQEGRVLVEYLGQEIAPNRHEFLGADVVQVARRAPPTEVTTHLGRRVLPHEAMPPNEQQPPLGTDTTLIASPVLDLSVGGGLRFYGTQGLADGRLAYWAERENLSPDRVVFYWLESQNASIAKPGAAAPDISVFWPKYQDRYLFIWPPTLDAYAHVITDAGGSTTATGLQFEAGSQPEIIFQDDGSQTQASIDPDTQRLIVHFAGSADTTNRMLLKFNSGSSLWYQPVYTQAQGRQLALDTNFVPPGTTTITVPSTAGLTVGMTVTGPGITGTATIVSIIDATRYVLSQRVAPGTNSFTYRGASTALNLATALSIVPGSTNPFFFSGGAWQVNGSTTTATAIIESGVLPVTTGAVSLELVHSHDFENQWDGGRLFVSRNGGTFTLVNFPDQSTMQSGGGSGVAWTGFQSGVTSSAVLFTNGVIGDTYRFRLQATWDSSAANPSPNWSIGAISIGAAAVLSSTSPPEIVTVASTAGLAVGMVVSGLGITGVVTITGILSGTQLLLSHTLPAGSSLLTFTDVDPTEPLSGSVLVGQRLERPSGKYSLAGAIVGGRCYQASAYISPYVSGVATAEAGAIIPVNAPPSFASGIPDNQLTVRWFEKISPPAGTTGFSDFHVPSKVGRYSVSYPDPTGDWKTLATMDQIRNRESMTLLLDGRVLVAGGVGIGNVILAHAELFDPATNTWKTTAPMNTASYIHKAVRLADGKVLVIGGFGPGSTRCEVFDPTTETWTTVGSISGRTHRYVATLLQNGKVLLTGGEDPGTGNPIATTLLYDPTTQAWSAGPNMLEGHGEHHAILLNSGKVLVYGGYDASWGTTTTSELYDPVSNSWAYTAGAPVSASYLQKGIKLGNGKVFVPDSPGPMLYDPQASTWSSTTASPALDSYSTSLAALPDGRLLLAGGPDKTTTIYNPTTASWSAGPPMRGVHSIPNLFTLSNGQILAIAGLSYSLDPNTLTTEVLENGSQIVMASNEGTENLTTEQVAGFIYQENNPANIGFNPNEEHAVKKNDRFWALRDDLNVTTGTGYTSEPFVLVAYTDPADGRPAMRPFRVRRETETYTFNYEWTAGLKIHGPMPLPLLQLPVGADGKIANTEVPGTPDNAPNGTAPDKYDSFTLEDRQGYKWVYRGTHNAGGPGTFGMLWYYPMDADFYVPGGAQPAVGTKLPYLRPLSAGVPVGHAVTGTALTVTYTPLWPENVPSMRVAETLTLPKFGLPEVRNQKSAEVYYQQSIAKNGATKTSVTLHDPTRAKKVTMAAAGLTDGIPDSIRTSVYQGKTYFQGLPPHLQTRFYFAPLESASGSLVFVGEFYDEIAGEDYLDLNVLSAEDETALIKLAEYETPAVQTKWSTAISTLLKTRLETYIEDPSRKGTYIVSTDPALTRDVLAKELAVMPDSDTARDSYALTATGQGTGYVTLVFSDGEVPTLTPAGDPPAVKIIQVLPELYKGDLKVRLSSNPLDEKVTLRHSGDFAAKPEDYEFEWRHSGPVDGKPPRTYTYTNAIYLGDSTNALERQWKYVQNPTVPRPPAAAYSTATWELPRLLTIKDADYDSASGLPGIILKANQDVNFTSGVPSLITFSADTDHLTGFVLYVNGAVALVHGNGVAALDALISENAYDLRLARAASLDDLPVEGESLVVVAEIAAKLHFRIFNAAGVQVFDANEDQLSGKSAEIAALKTRLTSLWAITNLAANDKIAVVSAASAIAEVDLDQDASTGLSPDGLTKQFRVHESFFIAGPNRIEVALYTDSDVGIQSNVNLRLEGSTRTDLVVGAGNWEVAASPATTESPKIQNRAIVGGSDGPMNSPLVIMSDQFFTMRYRPKTGIGNILATGGNQSAVPWSDWTRPALVEGWIKRVLAAINPFNQRMTDLYNNAVDTDVSLLTQAGTKWEGDIALTLDNISDASLIAIYETVLNRGKDISINSGYDVEGVNTALLLAAGYLNDLYTILGDEAFADAANPTISLDDQNTITEVNTSRFSFEGQVASSLDEELALLRGRDDFLKPDVTQSPFYNRLFWNYTRGINSGEALYAVNYNIKEKVGSSTENGSLNAADAQRMFPQGHGDAYGHYLTALKGYYKLLTHPSYTWKPQSEFVSLLGNTISVDYKDERKFAQAAAKVAATAEQVVALTHRQQYNDNPRDGWAHFRDGTKGGDFDNARHWGLDEWVSRAGQGSYYHWVVGNAMVKEEETVLTGIQKIDRSTVLELQKLPASGEVFQTTLDNANARLNPLGLSPGAIAFDISPAQLKAGNSHYEQVYGRALGAVLNAKGSFDQAGRMTRLLRNQENQIDDFNTAIEEQERAFTYKLIDLYGTPYPGDVGPGRTYVQNYNGPDLNNWFVVDRPTDLVDTSETITVEARVPTAIENFEGFNIHYINALAQSPDLVTRTFEIQPNQFVLFADQWSPDNDPGRRSVTGKLQQAMTDAQLARMAVLDALDRMSDTYDQFDRKSKLYQEIIKHNIVVLFETDQRNTLMDRLSIAEGAANLAKSTAEAVKDYEEKLAEAAAEAPPKSVGTSSDATSGLRSALQLAGLTIGGIAQASAIISEAAASTFSALKDKEERDTDFELERFGFNLEEQQLAYEYELEYKDMVDSFSEVSEMALRLQKASEEVRNLVALGDRLQLDRQIFRQRAAAIVQGYRTKDLTFRVFRNEALEQYRTLFDLASRYTYLAAKSYDYETGLLGTPHGQTVFRNIVASRALGDLTNGVPQATVSTLGDSGLAGTMAQLNADFSVAEGRLGINNPDQNGTLFSLRKELFRLPEDPATTADDDMWQQTLEQHIVSDLMADPDVAAQCLNLRKPDGTRVPGIVITFGSTIEHGKNYFGLGTAAGDHNYSPSNFATKIYSAGVVLPGYIGMDPYAFGSPGAGSPSSNGANALNATPYLYLIPVGMDRMLAPPLGDTNTLRSWAVHDQALPLPYNLGSTAFNGVQFFNANGTLSEQPWILRKHQAFRPVDDPAFFYSSMPQEFTSSRLIGRSVWNTTWKIVIPAYSLLENEQDGLNRFTATVRDIQLFLRTYSNAGN